MDEATFSAEVPATTPNKPLNWRWWMTAGCIVVLTLLLQWMRTTDYTGVVATKVGEQVVYRMSPWMMALFLLPILACFAFAFALVTLPSKLVRLLAAIPFLAAVAVLIALPTVLTARLAVSPEGFEHTAGFWWEPVTTSAKFANMESIAFRAIQRKGQKPSFELVFRAQDGDEVEIQKSTLLEAGLLSIFGKALRAGVTIEGWADGEVPEAEWLPG